MSINLMPWREERRKTLQRKFLNKIGLSAVIAVGVVVVGAMSLSTVIGGQERRNSLLEQNIETAQKDISEINNLETQRDRMLSRKQVIERLQADRDLLPNIFYQFAHNSIDGIIFTGMEHRNGSLHVFGKAMSNSAVASMMRNIEATPWFKNAEIIIIQNEMDAGRARRGSSTELAVNDPMDRYGYNFTIKSDITNPNAPVNEDEEDVRDVANTNNARRRN